jgi:hypothetical protein
MVTGALALTAARGQGHVNRDLTSMSWIASPPFTFGYHTGVLRLDGVVLPAHRYRWKPWGTQREYSSEAVTVRSDSRLVLSANQLHWRVDVHNSGATARQYTLSQDLYAMVGHTERGWGWLYDVPWSSDNYHDFITLERVRDTTAGDQPAYLLNRGQRRVRLGCPRVPGIQRDEDSAPMLMEYELPSHVDSPKDIPESAAGSVRDIHCGYDGRVVFEHVAEVSLAADTEVSLGSFEMRAGIVLSLQFRPSTGDGVILTHGNHPDSLQLGVDQGRLWLSIAGEREQAVQPLAEGEWHTIAVTLHEDHATLALNGVEVGRTRHWSASKRWVPILRDGVVEIADGRSPARAAYAFDTSPSDVEVSGAGARATWRVTVEPGQSVAVGVVCA